MELNFGTWRRWARYQDVDGCLITGRACVIEHRDLATEERGESEEGGRVVDEGQAGEENGEHGLEEGQRRGAVSQLWKVTEPFSGRHSTSGGRGSFGRVRT